MILIDNIYYPMDENFLNPSCKHINTVNTISNVDRKNYAVVFCGDCLKLLQRTEIRHPMGMY